MARFAVVAPPVILEALDKEGMLGDSHLVLAHDVAKHAQRYRELLHPDGRREAGRIRLGDKGRLVILDNSVIELKSAVNLDLIKAAHAAVAPTVTVLPDVMLHGAATVDTTLKALYEWPPKLGPFMVVPQGRDLNEFARCAENLSDDIYQITFWGIPRNLVGHVGSRRDAIAICHALNRSRRIHLLGFSDNMVDDLVCAKDPRVWAIDSAVPLRVGLFSLGLPPSPRGDWWENAVPGKKLGRNLHLARKWFS